MSFVKPLAKTGLFGLAGLAASGAFKNKNNNKPKPSLTTGDYATNTGVNYRPSMISNPGGY